MKEKKRKSLLELAQVPEAFRNTLLTVSFILALSPYFSGTDFGVFKIPDFPPDIDRLLMYGGPVIFVLCLCLYIPLWPLRLRTSRKKILILIDDEPAVREALKLAAARTQELSIYPLATINSRESLIRQLSQLQPDGVILDLDVPLGGTRLCQWIQEWRAELPVIFYTRHADHPSRVKEMLAVGARYEDIISKGEESEKDILSIEQRFQQLWRKVSDGNS